MKPVNSLTQTEDRADDRVGPETDPGTDDFARHLRPRDPRLPPGVDHAVAVLLVGAGLGAQAFVIGGHGGDPSFLYVLLPIAFSSWLCGFRATLVAIACAAVGQTWFFIEPRGSLRIADPADAIQLALFLVVALFIAVQYGRLKRSWRRNDAAVRELVASDRDRRASKRRLDAGLNAMPDPVLMLARAAHAQAGPRGADDFTIEYANEAAARVAASATPARGLVGSPLSAVAPLRASLGSTDALARVASTGEPLDRTVVVPADPAAAPGTAAATERIIEVRADRLGDGLIVQWRDVSEHRRAEQRTLLSEQRYRSLVETSGAIVWSTDPDGRVVAPQPAWLAFTGQAPDEMTGDGWAAAVHPDDRDRTRDAWAQALAHQQSYEIEHRVRRADGEYRDMLVRGVPLFDADGGVREWVGVDTDVTDRRRAEQIIADSERQLRRVLNGLYAFVGVLLPDGTLVGANEAPLRAAALAADDVLGKKVWDCYWFDYAADVQAQLRRWVEQSCHGETVRGDMECRMAGGRMVTVDFMLAPLRDEQGAITHLVASSVDVSARVRAQADLADRERHYRQLIEGLPMLAFTCAAEGARDYVSARWPEYTGMDDDDHLGLGWHAAVHPDDRAALAGRWSEAVVRGEPLAIEFRLRRADGRYRWFDGRAVPIRDAAGRVERWFGTHLDIDDRRHAEQRFRRLYESNLAGVVFYRFDGELTDPNDAFLHLLGYDRGSAPARLNWRELTPPEWTGVDAEQWERLNTDGRCGPFEKEFVRRDGTRVPVMITGADLDPGHHEHGVAYVMDMTQLKGVEEALRQTEADLRMANESLELRIQERTLELQHRSDQLRALALDLTETESRERKRLAQLLHDHFQQLVSAAKLKVGMLRRKLTDPGLIETVTQVESLLEETINASRSLATELSPPVLHDAGLGPALEWLGRRMEKDHELPVTVRFDPGCEPDNEQVRTIMFECVRELLVNVTRHAGPTTAELAVSMAAEGLLQVVVTDHGTGFDAHSLEMKAKPDGSFGLFSIKERLGLLGGLVRIRSHADQGTTVTMTVPVIVKSSAEGGPAGAPVDLPTVDADERVPSVRVVVADDHRLFREGLISLIAQESFVDIVGQANNGEEAIALAHQLKPDILIVDVTMPLLNGVQVTTRLSHELPAIKVIGLSMHERDDMAQAMRDAGAVAYCSKGGPTDALLNVLRSVASANK